MHDSRFIYYSLIAFNGEPHCMQWIKSVESLRKYNRKIPVHLFFFGEIPAIVQMTADKLDIVIHQQLLYREYLNELMPGKGDILSKNPRLHKHLVFENISNLHVSQVLYLDCDTFFFDDVAFLFQKYEIFSWYAKAEPNSKRDDIESGSNTFNNGDLKIRAAKEGVRFIGQYNSGVFLLNNGLWEKLWLLRQKFLSFVYRIMVGLYYNKSVNGDVLSDSFPTSISTDDINNRIDIPLGSEWIMGQIALWLTLGSIKELSHGEFSRYDVLQSREYYSLKPGDKPVLIHYFSNWEERFFELLSGKHLSAFASYAFRR
jgi:hypothetical protein